MKSEPLDDYPEVEGIDFNQPFDLNTIFKFYKTTGFQATNLALAAETIEKMVLKNL